MSAVLDCNNNGVADSLDIVKGVLHDNNRNNYPDECEPGSADSARHSQAVQPLPRHAREPYGQWRESVRRGRPDCNGNGIADSLDIVKGVLHDRNGNTVPDECE